MNYNKLTAIFNCNYDELLNILVRGNLSYDERNIILERLLELNKKNMNNNFNQYNTQPNTPQGFVNPVVPQFDFDFRPKPSSMKKDVTELTHPSLQGQSTNPYRNNFLPPNQNNVFNQQLPQGNNNLIDGVRNINDLFSNLTPESKKLLFQ